MKLFYRRLLSISIAVGVFCSLVIFSAAQTRWRNTQHYNKLDPDIYKIVKMTGSSTISFMSPDYVRKLQSLLPEGVISDPVAESFLPSVMYETGSPCMVIGTGRNYCKLMDLQLAWGRNFSEEDIDSYRKVCILESDIYNRVKDQNSKFMEINGETYEIIGVLTENDYSGSYPGEGDIYVPITTQYKYIMKTGESNGLINRIIVDKNGYSKKQLTKLMKSKAKHSGAEVSDIECMPYLEYEFIGGYIQELVMIFIISILVLFIAICNIIQIASACVLDREREIGLRTALGAASGQIMKQIAGEILSCALRGGIAGAAATSIFNTAINLSFHQVGFSFNLLTISFGILLAAVAGMSASLLPAKKAANLNPAAALREE